MPQAKQQRQAIQTTRRSTAPRLIATAAQSSLDAHFKPRAHSGQRRRPCDMFYAPGYVSVADFKDHCLNKQNCCFQRGICHEDEISESDVTGRPVWRSASSSTIEATSYSSYASLEAIDVVRLTARITLQRRDCHQGDTSESYRFCSSSRPRIGGQQNIHFERFP